MHNKRFHNNSKFHVARIFQKIVCVQQQRSIETRYEFLDTLLYRHDKLFLNCHMHAGYELVKLSYIIVLYTHTHMLQEQTLEQTIRLNTCVLSSIYSYIVASKKQITYSIVTKISWRKSAVNK